MNTGAAPEYLADQAVNDTDDRRLRDLLSRCFTKPQDAVFRDRRYFREPVPHRWVIRGPDGAPIAHAGVHDKCVTAQGVTHRIAGIAEVCVHPDCRGRGYVRRMLEPIHAWAAGKGYPFAVLFGNPAVYQSSGYVPVHNLSHGAETANGHVRQQPSPALVRTLGDTPWPASPVCLPGPPF